MKNKIPTSPFSTRFLGSAREVELRIRSLVQGRRRRPALVLLVLMAVGILLSGWVVSCRPAGETPDPVVQHLLADYYAETYGRTVYLAEKEPAQPKEGDICLRDIICLGQAPLEKGAGEAYQVTASWYDRQNGTLAWQDMEPGIVVVSRIEADGSFEKVLGAVNFSTDGLTIEQVIRQTAWGLADWETTLWRDGHTKPVGLGTEVKFAMEDADGEEQVEVLQDWEPIYGEGDYYALHKWNRLEIIAYHNAAENTLSALRIDSVHPDLYTPRGIHVGSTRAEVEAAYPEIQDSPYWGEPGDYLWYNSGTEGLGPAILFFFEGDTVTKITLNNMFD